MVPANKLLSAESENPVAPPQDEATVPHAPKKVLPRITFSRVFCCLVCTFFGWMIFMSTQQSEEMTYVRCGVCAWGKETVLDETGYDGTGRPYDATDPRSYG